MRVGRTFAYHGGRDPAGARCVWGAVLTAFTLFATYFLWTSERDKAAFALSASELRDSVVEAPATTVNPALTGRIIHVASTSVAPGQTLSDPDFGLSFPGAWGVSRHTEYCQWLESAVSSTVKESDGSETVR